MIFTFKELYEPVLKHIILKIMNHCQQNSSCLSSAEQNADAFSKENSNPLSSGSWIIVPAKRILTQGIRIVVNLSQAPLLSYWNILNLSDVDWLSVVSRERWCLQKGVEELWSVK